MVIGIIGGGASGMAAAIEAASDQNNRVVIFERQARVGRKLQATGNGRCNLSNLNASVCRYHGETPGFAKFALDRFNVSDTLAWFNDLGLYTVSDDNGKVYPYSDQANSVVDVLRFALDRANIELVTGEEVQRVKRSEQGFAVDYGDKKIMCDRLIVACGGLAGTKLGGTMSGYKLLSKFGHKTTKLRPALVQIKSDWTALTSLKGVRTNCLIKILCNDKLFNESQGELQFTEYGISGPVVFEVSRDVCQRTGCWTAAIDFIPQLSENQLLQLIEKKKSTQLPASDLLTGILHNRLGRVLVQAVGLNINAPIAQLQDSELAAVCARVKDFRIRLIEPLGMESAQVTAGGVCTAQFDPQTMESKLVSGLYACGEVLDIDGDCGGYNLQWAWSSGRLAGLNAGKE